MITELTQVPGAVIGDIIGVDDAGRPLVAWNGCAAVAALAVWTPNAPRWDDCVGARVLINFLN